MRLPSLLVLTAPEVAAVVSQLEGTAVSVRQVRYLLAGLTPRPPHTHLYGPADVALMRLAVRLEAQGLSAWVARVVLHYCGTELRAAWQTRAPVALVVRGVTGTIEPATATSDTLPARARVRLPSVWRGITSAMRQTRRVRPHVWRGRLAPLTTLTQATA